MSARVVKFVRVAIPVGTLFLLFLGWVASRFSQSSFVLPEITPKPPPALPDLVFAGRDQRVEGRVVDDQNRAVPDALVWLRAGDEPYWTYTDNEGAFRLERVGAGPWPVVVLAHGFEPYKSALATASEPCTVVMGAALALMPRHAPIERAPLNGRVVSALHNDLTGYEVLLTPRVPPETLDAPLPRRALCERDGRFALSDLALGEYSLHVLPAWARGGSWPDLTQPLQAGSPSTWSHSTAIAARELSIALTCGELRGALRTSAGNPLEGALVLISPAEDPSRVWPPISSAADGSLLARDLPPGSYKVSIRAGSAAAQIVATLTAQQALLLELEPLDVGRGR